MTAKYFTVQSLAVCAGVHRATFYRWMNKWVKQKKFSRNRNVKLISRRKAAELARLGDFELP